MFMRVPSFACCLSLAALLLGARSEALELPMPTDDGDVVGQVQVIQAKYEDTFADLGERYDLGYLELVAANPGVDPWLPGEGTEVVLPTRYILPAVPREGIVINLAEYRMYYFPKDRDVVHTYPLGIGREGWSSPVAVTRITAKTPNPAWYPPQSIRDEHAANGDPLPRVVPPGPDNPLGPFKFNLSLPSYLIHGSNKKFGIGMRVSHGCFRMYNQHVLALAEMVPVGTPVRIINEPYKLGLSNGKLYLEAHAPLEDDEPISLTEKHAAVVNTLLNHDQVTASLRLDWEMIRDIVAAEDGLPVQIAESSEALASQFETAF
ncbi:L,D-transpeptidase family protein [Stutzerimonas tarimensis]|uniref:L,D-transpeptidase family protein n=1 Tax=Stutzerimonas tarimensis TaxID=1507735 RepID=A0ABV7T3T6_9GAMM